MSILFHCVEKERRKYTNTITTSATSTARKVKGVTRRPTEILALLPILNKKRIPNKLKNRQKFNNKVNE